VDTYELHKQTLSGILKDLGDLGYKLTGAAMASIEGRLSVAFTRSYGMGWQAACLEMLTKLKRPTVKSDQP